MAERRCGGNADRGRGAGAAVVVAKEMEKYSVYVIFNINIVNSFNKLSRTR